MIISNAAVPPKTPGLHVARKKPQRIAEDDGPLPESREKRKDLFSEGEKKFSHDATAAAAPLELEKVAQCFEPLAAGVAESSGFPLPTSATTQSQKSLAAQRAHLEHQRNPSSTASFQSSIATVSPGKRPPIPTFTQTVDSHSNSGMVGGEFPHRARSHTSQTPSPTKSSAFSSYTGGASPFHALKKVGNGTLGKAAASLGLAGMGRSSSRSGMHGNEPSERDLMLLERKRMQAEHGDLVAKYEYMLERLKEDCQQAEVDAAEARRYLQEERDRSTALRKTYEQQIGKLKMENQLLKDKFGIKEIQSETESLQQAQLTTASEDTLLDTDVLFAHVNELTRKVHGLLFHDVQLPSTLPVQEECNPIEHTSPAPSISNQQAVRAVTPETSFQEASKTSAVESSPILRTGSTYVEEPAMSSCASQKEDAIPEACIPTPSPLPAVTSARASPIPEAISSVNERDTQERASADPHRQTTLKPQEIPLPPERSSSKEEETNPAVASSNVSLPVLGGNEDPTWTKSFMDILNDF